MVFVEIVNQKTNEVVDRIGPMTERRADKVEDGVNINLNHADYFTRIVPKNVGKKQNSNVA